MSNATRIEVLVIGGGQAGLAASYYLSKAAREHLILEQGRVGESWRSQRWDSFHLVTPNWCFRPPIPENAGSLTDGLDLDSFMARDEVVKRLERYAVSIQAPVRSGVRVTSLRRAHRGYIADTEAGRFHAASVVVATGAYQRPHTPTFRAQFDSDLVQLTADKYRRPGQLPPGGVLVVGSGQSGSQIADDLLRSGRRVYLSVASCGWVPRRYRGRDIAWWLVQMGFLEKTVDSVSSSEARLACFPQVSGIDGGRDLNVHTLAKDGATLLGQIRGGERNSVLVGPDLEQNLAAADAFATGVKQAIDSYAVQSRIDNIQDERWPEPSRRFDSPPLPGGELDLRSTGITSIIWACGYRPDFRWIKLPIFDRFGFPIHRRGVSEAEGLYFLGLPWLYKWKSATLLGAAEDAAFVVERIVTDDRACEPAQSVQPHHISILT